MKKTIFMGILYSLLGFSTVFAVENKELAKCAIVNGDLARLECYDNLTKKYKLNGKQKKKTTIVGKGKWDVRIDTNPIDDSKTVQLVLNASSGKSRWGKQIYLVARCQSNTTELYIGWNDYLGSKANVLTRVGKNKAITSQWDLSTDKKATFHSNPIPFLKEMLESNKLIAQVTPYNESPVTAVFDTTGFKNALKPLKETCGW